MPKGGLEPLSFPSLHLSLFAAFPRFFSIPGSSTEYTRLINLPQNGTNRALILSVSMRVPIEVSGRDTPIALKRTGYVSTFRDNDFGLG